MADQIKTEVLPENCLIKEYEYNVEKSLDSYREITIMKTEVTEELYDFETIENGAELFNVHDINTSKCSQPKNEIKLVSDNKLATEDLDMKNYKKEKFQANKYMCDTCSVGLEKDYLNYYRNTVNKKKVSKELNGKEAAVICCLCKTKILDEKLYGCNVKCCWKIDPNSRVFFRLNEKPFKCCTCDYATAIKSNLKKHVLVKHSKEEKRHKCEYCKYSTHRKEDLATHIRMHNNERSFKCDICEFTTVYKRNLRNHILIKHRGEVKKYACKSCEYSTPVKSTLKMHMRIHTDNKPFKCNICEYASAYKGNLRNHLLVRHSPEIKKYKCQNCDYSTHLKSNLVVHMRIHSNEKPYECNACEYATAYKRNLRKHMLTHRSKAIN